MKRAGSVLFMGSMGGSLLAYLFFVILARALQPGGLGAVGAVSYTHLTLPTSDLV